MLGDILGRSAGLTSAEPVLFRFLLLRPPLPSAFPPLPEDPGGPVGDRMALLLGLPFAEILALSTVGVPTIALPGAVVSQAETRGVAWSEAEGAEVSRLRSCGRALFAASGSAKSSRGD